MIKIIKAGKTDFRMTCNKCGCVFEYNVEDINDGYIKCPTCHKDYYGFEPDYLEKSLFDTGLAECEPAYQRLNECEGCPTYKQLRSPTGYIGDLPCQWCSKNPWKMTCDSATYTTSTSNETRGARSWTTYSPTAFTEEDRKITCKAEGVEYTTTLESSPATEFTITTEDIATSYTDLDETYTYYTIPSIDENK